MFFLACHTRATTPKDSAPTWLKGQTHAHTANSGDSSTPPADAMRWYARHGFDFVVVTDHNRVTRLASPDLLVIPGVELTQNVATCDPPPTGDHVCLLHLNALFLAEGGDDAIRLPGEDGESRLELYTRSIAVARARGGLVQLNHPNYHYAADAGLIVELARRGTLLLEIANMAWDSNNPGDATHPSTEALWDAALTAGARLYGVATDDAHHYDDAAAARARGESVFTGDLGFIMVRARKDPAAIRAAIERGDFYASTGVRLARAERGPDGFDVAVDDGTPGEHTFTLIAGGAVVEQRRGRAARFALPAGASYARVVVTGPTGQQAWLQPVWP